jgi:hexosaminidase
MQASYFMLVVAKVLMVVLVVVSIEGQPNALWPKPQSMNSTNTLYDLDPRTFTWVATGVKSSLLDEAFVRYKELVFWFKGDTTDIQSDGTTTTPTTTTTALATLTGIDVFVISRNESLEADESYTLTVKTPRVQLRAQTVFGAMRGLETFSQLVVYSGGKYSVQETSINDFPRFPFRGVLVDTSRHYIPLKIILAFLDAMAYNKFNVLHWHIVDDQSFPYVSQVYPHLSLKGAYNPKTHIYDRTQIAAVIEYARRRGIRVVVEFDSPGHTESWGRGYPQLLTPCYKQGKITSYYAINPTQNYTWDFLSNFFDEVARVFPDRYVHVGGDEVDFTCWASNPDVQAFMKAHGFSTYSQLEQYYENTLLELVARTGKSYIVWEDVFDNGVKILPDTVVEVWRGSWQTTIAKTTAAGYRSLLASPWYLNLISYGADWVNYYQVEPLDFPGTAAQKKLVIGGETTFWSEFIDGTNLLARAWPRASAIGERLWSAASVVSIPDASARIHYQRCRMILRGIPAEPANGPSFCPYEWNRI